MTRFPRIALLAATVSCLTAQAIAQDGTDFVYDVAFFERVTVGEVEITPFGIIEDSRCLDYRLCFRGNELVIAAVLHQGNRVREVPLRLGVLTPVPGGALRLTDSGTAPARNGATPLHRYSLDIEFIPLRVDTGS
ncbi:MAG: hypothetical protein AAF941_03855 [Pseudomonadota bacterium]